MRRLLPHWTLAAALVLTVASGVVNGWLSNRWGSPRTMVAAAERLQDVPHQFGDWRLESSESIEPQALAMLECAGYFQRTYRNQATQQRVNVAVLLGPAGPIAVHTPEICYSSRDYAIQEPPARVNVKRPDGPDHALWAMTFRSNDLEAAVLRVYFAWSGGGPWQAPENSRFAFVGLPHLYKIQLAGRLSRHEDPEADDPCRAFLQEFLPVLEGYLGQHTAN